MTSDDLVVLLIEDDPADAEYLQAILLDQNERTIRVDWVKNLEEAKP